MISTFPSAFAQVRRHVPFLFKSLHSPPSVNIEFFVRATGTTAGRNPHIYSILVRSFSYEFVGQPPVRLIENYPGGFWQQGQSQYESGNLEPVPCFEGWYIQARFDLMLNGSSFTGEDTLYARERTRRYPLVLDALR
ncbi:MAG: hypothetical protein ACKVS7_01435 [Gemmatimonadaceae bacterium]